VRGKAAQGLRFARSDLQRFGFLPHRLTRREQERVRQHSERKRQHRERVVRFREFEQHGKLGKLQ